MIHLTDSFRQITELTQLNKHVCYIGTMHTQP